MIFIMSNIKDPVISKVIVEQKQGHPTRKGLIKGLGSMIRLILK
jgi:hypothetical protein